MNRLSHLTVTTLLAALLSLLSTSCEDSFIFDYEGDCSVRYHIQFSYDMNMKFANAFAHEVTSVSLYAFDESGKLAYQAHEQGDTLATPGYGMTLEMNEGTYDLLAWCGVGNGESFAIPEAIVGVTTIEEMKCRMHRTHTNGQAYVDEDLRPLFHGQKRITIENTPGTHYETMYLTKNTNTVRVVLQHLSGEDVNPDNFTFEIQDFNGYMNYDNTLLDDELIVYQPWSVSSGSADVNADIYTATRGDKVNVALAEMTIGRLCIGHNPVLVVRNVESQEVILSIPLIDYALLVKGNYNREMKNQEYLDRQDEYNLTFFLDQSGSWISSVIIINSWRVVFNNEVID